MLQKLSLILIILLTLACNTEVFETIDKASRIRNVKWDPTIAIPLVYADIGVDNLLEQTETDFIRTEDDQSLTLLYSSTIFSLNSTDVFQIPNQYHYVALNLTTAEILTLNTMDSVRVNFSRSFSFDMGSNQLDSVLYKLGKLEVELVNSLPQKVTATTSIPASHKNGQALSTMITLAYAGPPAPPARQTETIFLDGATIDFTKGSQNHSEVTFDFSVLIEKNTAQTVTTGQQVLIQLRFLDQGYKIVHGLIDSYDISNGLDTLKVKIFNQSQPGSFTLVDPRVKFIFSNSFGIPVRSTFSRADGRDIQGNAVALTGYPNPFNIPYSLTPGTVAIDSFELNKSNSNFSAYVGNEPYWNFFEYDIDLNPLGSSNRNWVTDSSVVECKAVFEIPLYGTAKNYSLESKIPLDLHEIDFNVLDSLLFRLHTENGFPIDIRLQLYFEDSTTATIYDSLFISDLLIMPSADVDGNGLVQEIHPKTIDVMFDRMRLLNIQGANRLRLTGDFNTLFEGSTQPDVRLYEFYSILIQMGIQAKFNIVE